MKIPTILRVRKTGSRTEIMVLVKHPMGSDKRDSDKKGKMPTTTPCIEKMTFSLNDVNVAEAMMSSGVAENPLTSIMLYSAKQGDRVSVHWQDSVGNYGKENTIIK